MIPVAFTDTHGWIWYPVDFHATSVLILGILGFLIGLFIDLFRLHTKTKFHVRILWINGIAALALLISIVQIFSLAGSDAQKNFTIATNSVSTFYGVSQQLDRNPSETDLQSLSAELRVAGAKLWVVALYYDGGGRQDLNMEYVSSGLTNAGLMLLSSDLNNVKEAEDFIRKASSTFQKTSMDDIGGFTPQSMQSTLRQISEEEPHGFKENFSGS